MSTERERIRADRKLDELKDKAREWGDLVKENMRLQEVEEEHQRINGELREENNRLNNIINELEKWLKKEMKSLNIDTYVEYQLILNKIKELKGVDKE